MIVTVEAAGEQADRVVYAVLGKGQGGVLALALAAVQPKVEKVQSRERSSPTWRSRRARYHEGLTAAFVPGVLRDFDLPDLAAALAPRPLWIRRAPDADGRPRPHGPFAEGVRPGTRAYERAGEPTAFRVLHRPEGWPLDRVYASWLGRDRRSSDTVLGGGRRAPKGMAIATPAPGGGRTRSGPRR